MTDLEKQVIESARAVINAQLQQKEFEGVLLRVPLYKLAENIFALDRESITESEKRIVAIAKEVADDVRPSRYVTHELRQSVSLANLVSEVDILNRKEQKTSIDKIKDKYV